jgi:eukaryotic-like serine/threonine-protein kinase
MKIMRLIVFTCLGLIITSCTGCINKITPTPQPTSIQTQRLIPTAGIGSTFTRLADGMVMVRVPAGSFSMGSDHGNSDEQPVHTVYLNSFWIDKTDVTNAGFKMFVNDTGYRTDAEKVGYSWVFYGSGWNQKDANDWQYPDGPLAPASIFDHPVVHVSWNDALAYCAWAGARLPTEAEWEKAARGTDERTYPWGNEPPTCSLTTYWIRGDSVCSWTTSVVGGFPAGASPYGALDMAGNVWNWVNDWYGNTYYANSPLSDPTGPSAGKYRVLRGGAFNNLEYDLRSSGRFMLDPTISVNLVGFRCASSMP